MLWIFWCSSDTLTNLTAKNDKTYPQKGFWSHLSTKNIQNFSHCTQKQDLASSDGCERLEKGEGNSGWGDFKQKGKK